MTHIIFFICPYWHFLKTNLRFQAKLCDGCYHITQNSMTFGDAAIVTVKGCGYKINFWFMTKNEAVYRVKNADLSEKSGTMIIKKLISYYRDAKQHNRDLDWNGKLILKKQRRDSTIIFIVFWDFLMLNSSFTTSETMHNYYL